MLTPKNLEDEKKPVHDPYSLNHENYAQVIMKAVTGLSEHCRMSGRLCRFCRRIQKLGKLLDSAVLIISLESSKVK